MDTKFQTENIALQRIWDEVQRVQVDFCVAQEISAYYMSEHWLRSSRDVLDVGTGNGYYIRKICERFPDKRYTGIDISAELLELARPILADFNVSLQVRDFFVTDGQFDFVIMRLFWQHLLSSQLEEAVSRLERITRPGASVLIVDACDPYRLFVPALPQFEAVIAAYTEQQRATGRNRQAANEIVERVAGSRRWRIGCDLALILPSTIEGYLEKFRTIYGLWIELFEAVGDLQIDFTPAKRELAEWRRDKTAYTQAGLRVLRLDRIA